MKSIPLPLGRGAAAVLALLLVHCNRSGEDKKPSGAPNASEQKERVTVVPHVTWSKNTMLLSGSATGQGTFRLRGFELTGDFGGLPNDTVVAIGLHSMSATTGAAIVKDDESTVIAKLDAKAAVEPEFAFDPEEEVRIEFGGGITLKEKVPTIHEGFNLFSALAAVTERPIGFAGESAKAALPYGAILIDPNGDPKGGSLAGDPRTVGDIDYIALVRERPERHGAVCEVGKTHTELSLIDAAITIYDRRSAMIVKQGDFKADESCTPKGGSHDAGLGATITAIPTPANRAGNELIRRADRDAMRAFVQKFCETGPEAPKTNMVPRH